MGKNGGFYTEDFYEIEVVDETAVKKLVNYISNVHQFRPSDKAIRIYKEDRMSSVFIFKMLAAILKKTRRFDVKYGIANAVCHTFLEKKKNSFSGMHMKMTSFVKFSCITMTKRISIQDIVFYAI